MRLLKVPNSLEIMRVANGFIIEMPRPMKQELEAPDMGKAFMDSVTPAFKEIMRMKDEDPLLAKLREENEDAPDSFKEEEPPLESMGVDPYTHVFPTWEGVIDFLTKLVL